MGRWSLARFALLAATAAGFGSITVALQGPGVVLREQKISAEEGNFSGALSGDDHFGHSLAALGDLDRDGVRDLAVGAPDDDDGGMSRGAVWLLFLDPGGTVRSQSKISALSGGFLGRLDNNDRFGVSLTAIGDLDGDGTTEVAVGADQDDDGGFNRGALWVLFLGVSGQVRLEQKISQSAGGFGGSLRDGDRFGRSLAGLGDLDGDGVADLAVGADQDDDGGMNRGAVWILFLKPDGTVKTQAKISQTAGGFSGQLDDYDQFGASLARLGDLDGDGTIDLAAGADLDDDGAQGSGAVWILFLSPNGVKSQAKISASSGLALTGFDRLGTSVTALGDVDGDGSADLAAGAIGDDDGGLSRGAVWILLLDVAGGARGWQKISSSQGNFAGMLTNGDSFGSSLAALTDLDGDGKLDLAVGAENDDDGDTDSGAAWILFLDSLSAPNPVIRNGSGINRVLLTASRPPSISSTWDVQVDCRGHQPGFAFHFGADVPAIGPVVPVLGEWLVGFYRPRLFQKIAVHFGATVTISHAVPLDLTLIGTVFYSQAIVLGKPAPELTNALDGSVTY